MRELNVVVEMEQVSGSGVFGVIGNGIKSVAKGAVKFVKNNAAAIGAAVLTGGLSLVAGIAIGSSRKPSGGEIETDPNAVYGGLPPPQGPRKNPWDLSDLEFGQ